MLAVAAIVCNREKPMTAHRCRKTHHCVLLRQAGRMQASAQVYAHLSGPRCCGILAAPASGAIQQRRHRSIADTRQRA